VYESYIDPKIISEKFYENKNNFLGNKILVICNTVKKAQEIYQQLAELIDESELNILHNKFIKKDRSEKEKEILEFGRTYDDNKNVNLRSGIWVSTSIVEASLDIDFDYIFTELSDLNGLFQRLGRCNRKGIKDVSDYNCFVFTEIDRNILRHGDKGFIDDTIYKLSKEAIKTVDGILSESMKMKLINSYFTTDNLSKSAYIRDFNEVYDYISSLEPNEVEKNEAKLRNILSYSIIPEDVYYNNYDLIEM
jgi:CRISPR-associated endonuclease/helicase Cas3